MELKQRRPSAPQSKKPRRVVLTARWVTLASACATRFFLAAVLAAGSILGGYSPFALGFVAASGPGASGFFALLGACAGFLLTKSLAEAFRYLATAVLIFAISFAFYDLKICRTRYFMPFCAALMGGLTGFVYLAEQGWQAAGVICFFTELLLIFVSARCFALTSGQEVPGGQQRVAFLVASGALAISLHALPLPFGLSLGAILCTAAVLWCGGFLDTFSCIAAGVILGLSLDLAAGGGAVYTAAFGLGSLLCAGTAKWGRPMSGVSFLCGTLFVTLWSYSVTPNFLPMWNVLLGCCLYLALPLRVLGRLVLLLPAGAAPPQPQRAASPGTEPAPTHVPPEPTVSLQQRLTLQSGAFHTLYDQLSRDLSGLQISKTDPLDLFQRVSGHVCHGCVFRSVCWKREVEETRKFLRPVAELMERKGRADPSDFPVGFAARCSRLNELVNGVNQAYIAELTRRRYQGRLQEERQGLCRQYDRVSKLLGECAHALEPEAVAAMGSAPTLSAMAGVAAAHRPEQPVSGDAGGWFRDEDGMLRVVLCDGMGSGAEAARDSRFAYKLLEQFLTAGIGPEVALATVAGAMGLRWECTGSFTTIDLLELDLNTGDGTVYKFGAAPTYLRRGGILSRITCTTLPAGLQTGSTPDISRFHLQPGDMAVLVTDGVTNGEEDGWVREQIRAYQGDSPKDLAGDLLCHDQPAADDRTAIVLLIRGTAV